MAVRAALGAARFRLIRQALTESLTLAVIGGTLGWLLALWGVDLIVALSPESLPRLDEISIDRRVLGFTLLITLLSGLVFGIAPALQSSQVDLNATLKEGGRTTGGGRNRLRGLFIVTEFGLALMLLIGAGLMIRSFLQLQRVNPGFNPDRVVTAQIVLPQNRYGTASRVGEFQQRLLQKVQSLPGVQAAAASMSLPPDRLMMHNPFVVEGQPPASGQPQPTAEQVLISPDYFRTLGIRLRAGRPFTDADNTAGPPVVIINETMARSYFPNQNVVGSHIQTGDYDPAGQWVTIVGIVDDVKYSGASCLKTEIRVLNMLKSFISLRIPVPLYEREDSMVYQFIPGEALRRDLLLKLNDNAQQAIADQLAAFHKELHSVPVTGRSHYSLPMSRVPHKPDDLVLLYERVKEKVFPFLLPHIREWAKDHFECFFGNESNLAYDARVIHGDLGEYHICFDSERNRVNGIIDFGSSGLGDPAYDISVMIYQYGERFVRKFIRLYREISSYLKRARFYAGICELRWALNGIESGDIKWFLSHIGTARDIRYV